MALFRVDFSGRGELAERQQKLAQMLSRLQKISEGLNRECAFMQKPQKSAIYLTWHIVYKSNVPHNDDYFRIDPMYLLGFHLHLS